MTDYEDDLDAIRQALDEVPDEFDDMAMDALCALNRIENVLAKTNPGLASRLLRRAKEHDRKVFAYSGAYSIGHADDRELLEQAARALS